MHKHNASSWLTMPKSTITTKITLICLNNSKNLQVVAWPKKIESTKKEHIWTTTTTKTIIIWLQFTIYRCGAYALRYIIIAQNPKVGWLRMLNNNLNIEYCPRLHYMYTCKMQSPLQWFHLMLFLIIIGYYTLYYFRLFYLILFYHMLFSTIINFARLFHLILL